MIGAFRSAFGSKSVIGPVPVVISLGPLHDFSIGAPCNNTNIIICPTNKRNNQSQRFLLSGSQRFAAAEERSFGTKVTITKTYSMAKPENEENNQTWTTWEELLLACAVRRHGVDSWDSVAAEINKQNSSSRTLTASDCRHKYTDLKRRFSSPEGETVSEISWWLEELRKLRVDELRREVERYDLSISSLQMKVKRLEDEREKEEAEKVTGSLDLVKPAETGKNSDVPVIEPNREIDESVKEEPNRIGGDGTEEKSVREDSGRGSCESGAKDSERGDSVREGNDSPEFVEAKETSDVQSSASLPRKEETVGHDQPDNEDQSLAVNKTVVESGPLIDFMEILRSPPIGSHFWRRLESQVTN